MMSKWFAIVSVTAGWYVVFMANISDPLFCLIIETEKDHISKEWLRAPPPIYPHLEYEIPVYFVNQSKSIGIRIFVHTVQN